MIGQVFRSHHELNLGLFLMDISQFSHAIGSEMKIGIGKPSTIEMGFEKHISQNDLGIGPNLIILLEKGLIVRM